MYKRLSAEELARALEEMNPRADTIQRSRIKYLENELEAQRAENKKLKLQLDIVLDKLMQYTK